MKSTHLRSLLPDNLTFLKDACKTIHNLVTQYQSALQTLPSIAVATSLRNELDQAERECRP
jgi:hypothetical protein